MVWSGWFGWFGLSGLVDLTGLVWFVWLVVVASLVVEVSIGSCFTIFNGGSPSGNALIVSPFDNFT